MPKAWSTKREKQYEEVLKSELDQGRSKARAEEIAARTVNQTRRNRGETKDDKQRSDSVGNPNQRLEERSKIQLYNRAQSLGISGRSQMNKDELISAIRDRQ